jgi:uncharacterized membrane protein YvbJ
MKACPACAAENPDTSQQCAACGGPTGETYSSSVPGADSNKITLEVERSLQKNRLLGNGSDG